MGVGFSTHAASKENVVCNHPSQALLNPESNHAFFKLKPTLKISSSSLLLLSLFFSFLSSYNNTCNWDANHSNLTCIC